MSNHYAVHLKLIYVIFNVTCNWNDIKFLYQKEKQNLISGPGSMIKALHGPGQPISTPELYLNLRWGCLQYWGLWIKMQYITAITQDKVTSGLSILVYLFLSVLAISTPWKKWALTKSGDNFP